MAWQLAGQHVAACYAVSRRAVRFVQQLVVFDLAGFRYDRRRVWTAEVIGLIVVHQKNVVRRQLVGRESDRLERCIWQLVIELGW